MKGDWENELCLRHGYGIESNAHGLLFCGPYVDGERHGQGILFENSVGESQCIRVSEVSGSQYSRDCFFSVFFFGGDSFWTLPSPSFFDIALVSEPVLPPNHD